jgi:hypothetical protein
MWKLQQFIFKFSRHFALVVVVVVVVIVLVLVLVVVVVAAAVTRPVTTTTKVINFRVKINFSFVYAELFTLLHYFQMTV